MKRIISAISYLSQIPYFFIEKIKRVKFNTFVGGLIFGAIFSLIVNLFTVKIQETIDRQRTLEALEREITYHLIALNQIYGEYNKYKNYSGTDLLSLDLTLNKTFNTRIWDNTEASKYLLELDPNAAAELESYYESYIKPLNTLLVSNNNYYKELHKSCEPFYTLLSGKEPRPDSDCNKIAINSLKGHAIIVQSVDTNLNGVKKVFHPTKDRLNSVLLKLLMGNKSVEILK